MDQSEMMPRRPRKDKQRNLEQVLHAAHELFAERGTEVTMEDVARRAGVGIGTIYRRFGSKDQLFAAVSHGACSTMQRCLHESLEQTDDPINKLRLLMLEHYRQLEQWSALFERAPTSGHHDHSCGHNETQQLYANLHTLLQHLILDAQRAGRMRQGNAAVLAALCLELLTPHTMHHLRSAGCTTIEEMVAHVLPFVLHGLIAR